MSLRLVYLLLIPFSALILLGGCRRPTYPDTPSIEFSNLTRYIVTNSNFGTKVDSIVFTIRFKDGNGDLGLAPNEPPYAAFDVKYDSLGDTIKYNGSPPYNCNDYEIDYNGDTILVNRNVHFNNYFLELLVKQTNGTYLPYNFIQCGSLNGRFPPLAPAGYTGPLEGNLSFTMITQLKAVLENKTVKFRLYIEDRAFHQSNTVESNDVLLSY
jgi:hypothetical protein